MDHFTGRVAVITGGAGGLGREFALKAASLGMKLVLADVEQGSLDRTVGELRRLGADVVGQRCDVRHAADVLALADTAMQAFSGVHLLFNNAGVAGGGLIWENTEADWAWVMGVNVMGVVHGLRIFVPLMLECAKREEDYQGHIVNTASMAGLLNAPAMGIYNASKHAVESISETLYHDLELVRAPIRASVLCPYFVPTGIHQSERNRPQEARDGVPPTASQEAAKALSAKAVASGKVSAADVAAMTFKAIANEQFYIFSHPHALSDVATRMEDIVQMRHPSDPYAGAPQVRRSLRSKMGVDTD